MTRFLLSIALLTACMPALDEESWPIHAAKAHCDKILCDEDQALVLPKGEECYAIYQPAFEHFLWAVKNSGYQECTFDKDVADQWLKGIDDMDCEAFYLGQQPEVDGDIYDCGG